LGAGKTTLARGVLRGLGFVGRVKSPTYTLVELYPFSLFNLYHFDLYRITDQNEWEDAGFREYFNPASVCLVEWPEKAGGLLPDPDVEISLQFVGEGGEGGRVVTVVGLTEAGRACIAQLLS
jgi:tRNA threonylcarbamoyladenosine biosynthesis protein TsaE